MLLHLLLYRPDCFALAVRSTARAPGLFITTLILLFPVLAAAQAQWSGLAPYAVSAAPCLDSAAHARIALRLQNEIARLKSHEGLPELPSVRDKHPAFEMPIRAKSQANYYHPAAISSYVDHNVFSGSQDYACGSRTYNGHTGTDYFPWPFAWTAMDSNWIEVIAAAPGIIVYKEDGNDDRICDGSGASWNAVYVQHDDGSIAWYGHLKAGSLTGKKVGDPVGTGEFLGIVGSSGNSTGPHLHFEVRDADGSGIDPYIGSCNNMNAESWWVNQDPYQVSTITKILFHDTLPVFGVCGTSDEERPNIKQRFYASDEIYLGIYLRDPRIGQKIVIRALRPDGTLYKRWESSVTSSGAAGYEIVNLKINRTPLYGDWTVEVDFEQQVFKASFQLCHGEKICTCDKPDNLRFIAHPGPPKFYWDSHDNAEEYQVRFETRSSSVRNFYTTANSIDIRGIGVGNILQWQVRARCGYAMSDWSQGTVPRTVNSTADLTDSIDNDHPLREASGWHWPDETGTQLALYDLNGQLLEKTHGERLTVPFNLTSGLYVLEKLTPDGYRQFVRVSW